MWYELLAGGSVSLFLLLMLTGRIGLPSIYHTVHGGVCDLAETA